MATQAQIAANRRNAQRSTGPRTAEGKITASQNALRHGLCGGIPQMHDERQDEIDELLALLREENQPVGADEEFLVYKMAEHALFLKRASFQITEELDEAAHGNENVGLLGVYLRYHTTFDRGFNRNLQDLRKLQKERRLQEIGSVSQEPAGGDDAGEEAPAASTPEPETPPPPASEAVPIPPKPPAPAPPRPESPAIRDTPSPKSAPNAPGIPPKAPPRAA